MSRKDLNRKKNTSAAPSSKPSVLAILHKPGGNDVVDLNGSSDDGDDKGIFDSPPRSNKNNNLKKKREKPGGSKSDSGDWGDWGDLGNPTNTNRPKSSGGSKDEPLRVASSNDSEESEERKSSENNTKVRSDAV